MAPGTTTGALGVTSWFFRHERRKVDACACERGKYGSGADDGGNFHFGGAGEGAASGLAFSAFTRNPARLTGACLGDDRGHGTLRGLSLFNTCHPFSFMKHLTVFCLVAGSLTLANIAHAQPVARQLAYFPEFKSNFSAGIGFTAAGDTKFGGVKTGDVEATRYRFIGGVDVPVSDAWSMEVGVLFDRLDLDSSSSLIPLSDRLDAIAAVIGVSWKINDAWSAKVDLSPGFYGDAEVDAGDAFTVPAVVAAQWRFRPDLSFTFGVSVQPFADTTVMPLLGVRWAIDERWTLTAGVPRTEITYALNGRTRVFGGISMQGGAYAVDDPSVTAPAGKNLRDTKIEVSEIRGVFGLRRELGRGIVLGLEAGYAFERTFDYYDRGLEVEADGAVFGAISISGAF